MNTAVFICDFFGDDHRFYHKVEVELPVGKNGKHEKLKAFSNPAETLINGVPVSGVVAFVYERKEKSNVGNF